MKDLTNTCQNTSHETYYETLDKNTKPFTKIITKTFTKIITKIFTKIFTKILTKQNHLQNRLQNRLQKRLQKHLQKYLQKYLQNQRSFKNAICLCSGHPKQSFEYHCRQSRYTFRGTFLLHTLGDVCVAMVVRTTSRRTEIHSVRSISQTPRARPTKLSPRKRVHFL